MKTPYLLGAVLSGALVATGAMAGEIRPDLMMLAPKDFSIESLTGARLLRFDTVVVNVGPGRFEVKKDAAGTVWQRIQDDDPVTGGWTEVHTDAQMFFAGDGHNHWHVFQFQDWTIARVVDPRNILKSGAKTGFCFYDNYQYTATSGRVYTTVSPFSACNERADSSVWMGLSVGWGDEYPSSIGLQYIPITGLPGGEYFVTLEADPRDQFTETVEGNNTSWARIRIKGKGKSVTVLETGIGLPPP